MDSEDSSPQQPSTPAPLKPTEFLCGDSGQLTLIMVHKLIVKGFLLKDVQAMVSSSELYLKKQVLTRILGKSVRAARRQKDQFGVALLNHQQSATAYQFAEALEGAIDVFGTQRLAEEWLCQPSKYLDGQAPVDIVDEPVGLRAVKQYLERVEYGVYQ